MMVGLKEALEYAVDLSPAKIYDINNGKYTDKQLIRVKDCIAAPIQVTRLESLIEYISRNIDDLNQKEMFINIESPRSVSLQSRYNRDKERDTYIKCLALIPKINYENFYTNENFNILMQSSFQDTEDKKLILQVIGNLREEVIKTTGDDGVSQSVTVKTGIAEVGNVRVPNPVNLKPFRTFVEIQQPESKFIFRMRDGGNCALFEADGGAWELQARKNIRDYLSQHLEEIDTDIMIMG